MAPTDRLLLDSEAANLLRMTTRELLKLARVGSVPSVQLPDGDVRFLHSDLLGLIEKHRCPAVACSQSPGLSQAKGARK